MEEGAYHFPSVGLFQTNPCPLCGVWKLTLRVHTTLTKEMKTGLPPTEGRTQEGEALPHPARPSVPVPAVSD